MAYRQTSLAKFGFKNRNINTSPDKNNNGRGKSEKRKISKNVYEAEKRCRTFVASWSKQFPGIEYTANGVVCSVCLGQYKTQTIYWGQVTSWGGQVDLIPVCPTGQVTIKVSVYPWPSHGGVLYSF